MEKEKKVVNTDEKWKHSKAFKVQQDQKNINSPGDEESLHAV